MTLESSTVPTCPLDVYLNDGQVAGSSGLGREPVLEPEEVIEEVTEEIVDVLCESDNEDDNNHDNDQGEAPVYVETVETLSVTLVTTRLYVGEELVSERRQHTFDSSLHYQPDNIDWMNFFRNMQEEVIRHAQTQHRREAMAEELPTVEDDSRSTLPRVN